MNLYEIALPVKDNAGDTYPNELHVQWQEHALAVAGGYTRRPAGQGAWKDKDGTIYRDVMIPYRVACSHVQWTGLIDKAFELFPDQLAFYTVLLSHDVVIVERPAKLADPHIPRYRVDGKTVTGDLDSDWIGHESARGAPYAVYDVVEQEHLPGRFSNLDAALASADELNAATGEPPHGYTLHEGLGWWYWTTCKGRVKSEDKYTSKEQAARGAYLDRLYERAHLREWPDCNKCGGVHHPHRCPACL